VRGEMTCGSRHIAGKSHDLAEGDVRQSKSLGTMASPVNAARAPAA